MLSVSHVTNRPNNLTSVSLSHKARAKSVILSIFIYEFFL
jgi:hypothetical protein